MNEQVLELLSAYLDGEISQEQKTTVEQWLKKDKAIAEEYKQMKSFSLAINHTRPAEVIVPKDFRTSIMTKLNQPNTGAPSGSQGKIRDGRFFNQHWMNYMMAGTVLIGLITFFVVQDKNNQEKIDQIEYLVDDLSGSQKSSKLILPEYTSHGGAQQGSQSNLLSTDSQAEANNSLLNDELGAQNLTGQVYRRGKLKNDRPMNNHSDLNASIQDQFSGHLESVRNWDVLLIEKRLKKNNLKSNVSSVQILNLAQKNNLNPGLIISMLKLNPAQDLEKMVNIIRSNLNQHSTLSNEQRLKLIIKEFDGSSKWEKIIYNSLQP